MAATQVAYETETGRILAIHHSQGEAGGPQSLKQDTANLTGVAEYGITVISVKPDDIDSERFYKIDHERKTLIEVPEGEGGIRFSFEEIQPPS